MTCEAIHDKATFRVIVVPVVFNCHVMSYCHASCRIVLYRFICRVALSIVVSCVVSYVVRRPQTATLCHLMWHQQDSVHMYLFAKKKIIRKLLHALC